MNAKILLINYSQNIKNHLPSHQELIILVMKKEEKQVEKEDIKITDFS